MTIKELLSRLGYDLSKQVVGELGSLSLDDEIDSEGVGIYERMVKPRWGIDAVSVSIRHERLQFYPPQSRTFYLEPSQSKLNAKWNGVIERKVYYPRDLKTIGGGEAQ